MKKNRDKTENIFNKIIPNIVWILSLVFFVFLILDWYNPLMGFLENKIAKILLGLFCLFSTINSIMFIKQLVKKDNF